ncbi:hypothetical protein AB7C87_05175 [Natrarchaeobius sp. A-rgal3]|uniref:hypothetical protein n=1 Tax=Natrarchaeobius versutus TaxID=1679078 RepID=UPI00350FC3B4
MNPLNRTKTFGAKLFPYVPWTAIAVAMVCTILAVNGIWRVHVFPDPSFIQVVLNPFYYVSNMFVHSDWAHYSGNVQLWLPFAAVLAWLTSDKHVLAIAVTANVLATVIALAMGQIGFGLSSTVLAVAAATLVRSTGYAMQNASTETLQAAVAGALVPVAGAFLFIFVLAGGSTNIGHFHHFLGFLFGGAIEIMYVLGEREREDRVRDIPRGIGR